VENIESTDDLLHITMQALYQQELIPFVVAIAICFGSTKYNNLRFKCKAHATHSRDVSAIAAISHKEGKSTVHSFELRLAKEAVEDVANCPPGPATANQDAVQEGFGEEGRNARMRTSGNGWVGSATAAVKAWSSQVRISSGAHGWALYLERQQTFWLTVWKYPARIQQVYVGENVDAPAAGVFLLPVGENDVAGGVRRFTGSARTVALGVFTAARFR
jgi:hypothetical protein